MYKSAVGTSGKTIAARIMPDSNFVEEILAICRENELEAAYIPTCIGSLKKARFVYAIPDDSTYFKMVYCDPVELDGPIEFLNAQGIVAKDENGEYLLHLHVLMSDKDMRVYGGHILDEGNIVLATMDLVLNEIKGINLARKYDNESGFYFFTPEEA